MKKVVCIFLIGIFLTGCQTEKSPLENDSFVKDIFSSKEIKSLDKLLTFVDKQVMLKSNKEKISEAYHAYFDSLQIYVERNEMDKFALDEDIRTEIFQVLKNDGIFDEIFIEDIPTKAYLQGMEFENPEWLKRVEINFQGKYRELIRSLSQVDTAFKYVNESFEMFGDFSPSLAAGLVCNSENYDFSIERIRLFGAIFCLTREETMQTKYKKYLEGKK